MVAKTIERCRVETWIKSKNEVFSLFINQFLETLFDCFEPLNGEFFFSEGVKLFSVNVSQGRYSFFTDECFPVYKRELMPGEHEYSYRILGERD